MKTEISSESYYNISDDFSNNENAKEMSNIIAALENCGNTCCINAALQVIFHLPFIENILENPNEEIAQIGQSIKNLFYEVKFAEYVCNPIDFVCDYKSIYESDRPDESYCDALECLCHLFEIIESNFNQQIHLYPCQLKKRITYQNGHSFIKNIERELFLELYLYNTNCNTINEWVHILFSKVEEEYTHCPNDDKIILCKYSLFIDPLPLILFIHVNRYYFSSESQNVERIPCNIEINNEILIHNTKFYFVGAILHCGSRDSGHYKVLINNCDNTYMYSDAFIEKLEDIELSDFKENYELLIYTQK